MKTSLVIAATNGNFSYLDCVLAHYRDGVVKPDQVVISLSNAHLVNASRISALKTKYSDIFEDLKLLQHNHIMVQGPNRDSATMAADNEIIISNDADDIPHPQRVQVIKHYFENHDILHLNHSYQTHDDMQFREVNMGEVQMLDAEQTYKYLFPNYNGEPYSGRRPNPAVYGFGKTHYSGYGPWECIHAGCPSFHKSVFDSIRWRNTEEYAWDFDFDFDVVFHFKKSVMIDSKLLWYNQNPDRRNNPSVKNLGILYKE